MPLSVASGTATLNTLSCSTGPTSTTVARINVTTTATTAAVTLADQPQGSMAINGVTAASTSFTPSVVPPTATTAQANSNPDKAANDHANVHGERHTEFAGEHTSVSRYSRVLWLQSSRRRESLSAAPSG